MVKSLILLFTILFILVTSTVSGFSPNNPKIIAVSVPCPFPVKARDPKSSVLI